MSPSTVPFRVAIGLQNHETIHTLSGQLQSYRKTANFGPPIHIQCGRGTSLRDGFVDVADMLLSAITHARDVRVQHGANLGLGMVHGPLYIPCATSGPGRPVLFHTILFALVDDEGIVAWMLPEEACPPEARFVYKRLGELFTSLQKECMRKTSKATVALQEQLLPAVMDHLRPLPRHFGELQHLQ